MDNQEDFERRERFRRIMSKTLMVFCITLASGGIIYPLSRIPGCLEEEHKREMKVRDYLFTGTVQEDNLSFRIVDYKDNNGYIKKKVEMEVSNPERELRFIDIGPDLVADTLFVNQLNRNRTKTVFTTSSPQYPQIQEAYQSYLEKIIQEKTRILEESIK